MLVEDDNLLGVNRSGTRMQYEEYDTDEYISIDRDDEDKPYLNPNPEIEAFTKEDFIELWKETKRNRPMQFPVDEFCIRVCNRCGFSGVVHNRQTFCPICYEIMETINANPNSEFDATFKRWEEEKNFIEKIINGDLLKFVKEFNKNITIEEKVEYEFGDELKTAE